jgi:hypothetical protein
MLGSTALLPGFMARMGSAVRFRRVLHTQSRRSDGLRLTCWRAAADGIGALFVRFRQQTGSSGLSLFGLWSSWDKLLATFDEDGPEAVIAAIRTIETDDRQSCRYPRSSWSDDASTVLVSR